MTAKTAHSNEISDELNPDFIFNGTSTRVLVEIANGKIDALLQVKKELANRGLDLQGNWIGFKRAAAENFTK